jgi:GNAT superfamily N-acetyltransferase
MKFLIDTNIFIPLEPTRLSEVESNTAKATKFAQIAAIAGHHLYVHPAGRKDLSQDTDKERRNLREILFNKYPCLPDLPPISAHLESVLGYADQGSNDWVDHQLIAALYGNATDFLVTEDRSLRKKTARLALEDRVATINEAISIVQDLFEKDLPPPPAVRNVKAYALDKDDPIFQSFREDYSGFDDWFIKCQLEHRQVWLIEGKESHLAAFCIIKKENSFVFGLKGRVLKICSFKVSEEYNGFRYGELLLKTVFNHAVVNRYDWIYITVFEKYADLINLLEDFGFQNLNMKTENRELIFSKPMSFSKEDHDSVDSLSFNIRYGPFALKLKGIPAYILPIKPRYHRLLFPELEKQLELHPGHHPFGNSIRKAYLSNALIRTITPGSIIFFYRSEDVHSVMSIGVVESTLVSSSPTEIARYVGKRTVYTFSEIEKICKNEVLAILFRQSRILRLPITLRELKKNGVLAAAPQSIVTIPEEALDWIQFRINE